VRTSKVRPQSMERIQKILARGGIASRRAAEQLITAGRVRVNGRIVTELGAKADPRRDRVEVDGKRVVAEQSIYVVLHKPRGVVSTMSDPEGRPTVRELLTEAGGRVFPVGRLDFATSGILLCTNDGEMADGLLHPRKEVPKTYVVKVKGLMTPDDLDVWRNGVRLEDGMTLPAQAKMLRHEGDKTWIELTIREGRNQQIRRMGEATGFPVMRLARVSFAGIDLEGLAPGRWRAMTRDELLQLKKTYGVPRSIAAATPLVQAPGKRPTARTPGARPQGTRPQGTRTQGTRTEGGRTEGSRTEGGRTGGARYGGGAPGRRSPETKNDWGGGVRRGSSQREEAEPSRDPHGGRLGRTRTTGTGGGIGARGPTDRVKGRRGR
jgi:23S rRNA pseudouridine2605 synthase